MFAKGGPPVLDDGFDEPGRQGYHDSPSSVGVLRSGRLIPARWPGGEGKEKDSRESSGFVGARARRSDGAEWWWQWRVRGRGDQVKNLGMGLRDS